MNIAVRTPPNERPSDDPPLPVAPPPPPDFPMRVAPATTPTPLQMLQLLVERAADMETMQKFMDLAERHEKAEARRSYYAAMADFRKEQVKVVRSGSHKNGPLTGTKYAKLHDFVGATAEALSKYGLSATWKILRDEPNWIEVACIVSHAAGHEEMRTMGGPPDAGGAKNVIQARASTVSYLEKYTLKMALGLAEQDDDNDGAGADRGPDLITEKQVADLEALISEVGANRARFLKHINVEKLTDLHASKYQAAVAALEARRNR